MKRSGVGDAQGRPGAPVTAEDSRGDPVTATRPGTRDFLGRNRGGGLFSEAVNQRIGSWLALAAERSGLHPSMLTVANVILGVGTGTAVCVFAGRIGLVGGLLALLGWQLAYCLDCADGQLARVTGQSSSHGARVDVLCDFAVQTAMCAAIASVAQAHTPEPVGLWVAFGMLWVLNLFTSVLGKADEQRAHSLIRSTSSAVRIAKLIRDPGLLALVVGLLVMLWPAGMVWLVAVMLVVNGGFLLASIANEVRLSLRVTR